ncbi:MAG: iron ABC transporter permease [Pseudomonadota bacterium]
MTSDALLSGHGVRSPLDGVHKLFIALIFALCVAGGVSLFTSSAGDIDVLISEDETAARLIFFEIRLPRTILAVLIGAALGASGAALQGYFRNPLAEPGVIGVSSAGALGAVFALYFGLSSTFTLALPVSAIASALAAAFILQAISFQKSSTTLILAGVAISSICAALTSLALNLSSNPFASQEIIFWLLGSLVDRSMNHVALAAPFIIAGLVSLLVAARDLNALSLDEDVARSLGVDLNLIRTLIIGGSALAVGAATAVCGVIGFVGLVAPHLLRPLVGYRPGVLVAASAVGGALLLTCADILVRIVPLNSELRLGVATSLIGAPFFLYLAVRTRGSDLE